MKRLLVFLAFATIVCVDAAHVPAAFTIRVDYSLDSNDFFDTAAKRAGLEAAVARIERVLAPTSLLAVAPNSSDWRIGFSNPATGASYQISTAANVGVDAIAGAGAADQYGFAGLNTDEWVLFAGGRDITTGAAAVGGTGTGVNFTSTFDDPNGPHHRGLIPNTPSNTVNDLPVWGGAISFDSVGVNWHFDPTTAAASGTTDLYSIALHEIGHAMGLNLSFNQFTEDQVGSTYSGSETIAALNADNGTSLTSMDLVSSTNRHWADNTYDSFIFQEGDPNLVGTVGLGVGQDLIMEPIANFTPTISRLELTNVDVAAFRDLGWATVSAVPEPNAMIMIAGLLGVMTLRRRRV